MKKFFTIIPLQPKGQLEAYNYVCKGNKALNLEEKSSFPILSAIKAYVQKGEDFSVVAILTPGESVKKNCEIFKEELNSLCKKYELCNPKLSIAEVSDNESVSSQLDNFSKLIDYTSDEDEIFSCMTYGTKPLSSTLMTTIRYAARIKKNTAISCIVYGKVNRNVTPWTGELYDMTALIRMDEFINKLSEYKVENPEAVIKNLLSEK